MEENETYNLFEMALSLYSKYGIRSVTMDDISRELGVSKKTIYQQVSDKKELVNRVIEYEMDRMNQQMAEMKGNEFNAIDELIKVNKHIHAAIISFSPTFYYDLKKYFPDLFKQWIMKRRALIVDTVTRNMSNGKNAGLYRIEMDEHIISRLYVARMEMLQDNDIIKNREFLSHNFFREIFLYHLHGICNPEGLKYLAQHNEII